MIHEIDHALDRVRTMQNQILDKQKFHGWSGPCRLISAALTLTTGAFIRFGAPLNELTVLYHWVALLSAVVAIHAFSMGHWFITAPEIRGNWKRLRPLLDPLPPLAVGGLISLALLAQEQWGLLVGVWALHFGLANYGLRKVLPKAIVYVALFYLSAGSACLILAPDFLNPLPMVIIFSIGELAGGIILYLDKKRTLR